MNESSTRDAGATPVPASGLSADPGLLALTRMVYILFAVGLFVQLTFVAGVIVNYVKIDDVRNTWLESHFRWQIRTFWWGLLWGVIGVVFSVIGIGYFILVVAAIWVLYRIIKGWLRLEEGKPMEFARS